MTQREDLIENFDGEAWQFGVHVAARHHAIEYIVVVVKLMSHCRVRWYHF